MLRLILASLLMASATSVLVAAEAYPNPDLLIEPETLGKAAKEFVILDARMQPLYAELHAGNALTVDQEAWAKAFGDGTDAAGWSKRIGDLGIDAKTKVVVYDDNQNKDAARIWWILRYWGVEDVRLLNGGWKAWFAARPAFGSGTPVPPTAKPFKATPIADRLATKEELLKSLGDKSIQIVDARSTAEHCGTEKMKNKRGGAIPGAKNLEWIELIDRSNGRFKSADELKKLFAAAGIALDQPTAAHCQSGGRSSVMAFAMELMGAPQVSNYYRSWGEWGNADDTPIEKPKS